METKRFPWIKILLLAGDALALALVTLAGLATHG